MPFFSINRSPKAGSAPEWIIAGLGNPGLKYEGSRHNCGFMALDVISEKCGVEVKNLKFKALCATGHIDKVAVLLMKPQTYVNLSGEALRAASTFYKIPPERVLVIFDDMSLATGRLRVRRDGSDGGHNGIKSIISDLGSERFPRIKIGIGMPQNPDYDIKDWVLGKFQASELESVRAAAAAAAEAAFDIILNGTETAMNKFNGK